MSEITVNALGKLNLGLDVVGTLPNGYHRVDMVMQTVKLADTLTIATREDSEIHITCTKDFVPVDESNLAYKAVLLLRRHFPGRVGGVDIHIKKMIPVAAGMAGGSSDAAAVVYGLNELFSLGMKKNFMMQISLELGADVPFCLFRGTARSTGIGERLERLPAIPQMRFLITKPPVSVSTAECYAAFDKVSDVIHPDMDALVNAISSGDMDGILSNMGNVLESVTAKKYPVIEEIKSVMRECGARNAVMTGSGPTVFGVFMPGDDIDKAYGEIGKRGLSKGLYTCGPYLI